MFNLLSSFSSKSPPPARAPVSKNRARVFRERSATDRIPGWTPLLTYPWVVTLLY
jgi:hypothetical protein